jgi:Putative transmembrane protein (PGPGW)
MSTMVNWLRTTLDWLASHAALTTVMLAVSIVVLVGSLWFCHYVLTTIPPDYFIREHKPLAAWRKSRPVLWWTIMLGKNLVGLLLVAAGVIMIFTPGQGILTLLLGISLLDIPGKRSLERKIIQRPTVLKLINRLRARADQPPLVSS